MVKRFIIRPHRSVLCALMAASLSILQGCSSGPAFQQVSASLQTVEQDKARVILFRQSHLQAAFATYDLAVDHKPIGGLTNGSFLVIEHPAGTVQMTKLNDFLTKDFDFSFPVEAGKTYYMEFEMNGSTILVGGGLFIPIANRADHKQFCAPGLCASFEDPAEALEKLKPLTLGSEP